MVSKIVILINSAHPPIFELAKAEKGGVELAGGSAEIYRIAQVQPDSIGDSGGPHGSNINLPILEPEELCSMNIDAILCGKAASWGGFSTDWRAFWDKTGRIWIEGGFYAKAAGMFVSSRMPGTAHESAFTTSISTFAHHGMVYVPFGYKHAEEDLRNTTETHGCSPWGAGTFTGPDGNRQPSAFELRLAKMQGMAFYEAVSKLCFDHPLPDNTKPPTIDVNIPDSGTASIKEVNPVN